MKVDCDLELEHEGRCYRLRSVKGCDKAAFDLIVPGATALLDLLRQAYTLRKTGSLALQWLPGPFEVRIWLRDRLVTTWSRL